MADALSELPATVNTVDAKSSLCDEASDSLPSIESAAASPGPETHSLGASGEHNNHEEEQMATCRICLDDEISNSLIRPCHCRGTMQYVHAECLNAWRESATKGRGRGAVTCEHCQFKYVDTVKLRRPLRTFLAPVAMGIAGGLLQALPFVLVLLRDFIQEFEGPYNLCAPQRSEYPQSTEVQMAIQLWKTVLLPVSLFVNPLQSALATSPTTASTIIEPTNSPECMPVMPRIYLGFFAAFLVSIYHLSLRAIRTAYPPLRLAHAALKEPAQSLRVLWSLRSGVIVYELLSRYFMAPGYAGPGIICALFAALPFLLPEPLEIAVKDLGSTQRATPPVGP